MCVIKKIVFVYMCVLVIFEREKLIQIKNTSTVKVKVSQSLLYCQFCHMYRTYIQRIEIALLSYSLVHTDNTKH